MKVTVEFLSLPNIARLVGGKTVTIDFLGQTVDDLVHEVAKKYGSAVQRFLLDENGRLDMSLAVVLNNQDWIHQGELDRPVKDGDRVTIIMLVGGG